MSSELPDKCRKCVKSSIVAFHKDCVYCHKIEMEEEILCELNRFIQDWDSFQCHAFQPRLEIVGKQEASKRTEPVEPQMTLLKVTVADFLESEKGKYEKALALQNLRNDPDKIIMDLNYHFFWNVFGRKPVFTLQNKEFSLLYNIFSRCNEIVGGFAELSWLAADHIHLFVNSDGERSVEDMAQDLKRYSSEALIKEMEGFNEKSEGVWDKAYFVQTIV